MKKAIALLLLTVTAIFALSCGSNEDFNFEIRKGEVGYHELGLYFKLTKDFSEKHPYEHIEKYYSNGEARFFYNVYSPEGIEKNLGLDPDITVEEYTKKFIIFNSLEMDYDYDAERDRATLDYVYTYTSDEYEPERYVYLILRGSAHLYVITMSCDEEVYPEYKDFFDELIDVIYAE